MKKNIILSVITFLFLHGLSAQPLYSEDFEDFTLGNVGTDSSGQTPGQEGWYTYSQQAFETNTSYNDLFQIENTTTNGKTIVMYPHPAPYLSKGTRISKNLNTEISNRTLGNDIIKLEIDFYTGKQTDSFSSEIYFGLSRNINITAGYVFDSNTGKLKGTHHDETVTPLPKNYQSNLNDNNQPLIVPFNTWLHCIIYTDYINNKVIFEIPSLGISVTDDFYRDVPYPNNIANHIMESFRAYTWNVETNDIELPTYKFDNLKVTALNQILSTEEVHSNQFNLYPNPAKDVVVITNQENKAVKQIKIYDVTGKLIDTQNFDNKTEIQFTVENLTSGIYLLHLKTNEGTAVKKLIVQ